MKGKFLIFPIIMLLSAVFSLESYSQEMVLKAGVAKTDITPTEPVRLGGYSLRDGLTTGVYGKLYLTVSGIRAGK